MVRKDVLRAGGVALFTIACGNARHASAGLESTGGSTAASQGGGGGSTPMATAGSANPTDAAPAETLCLDGCFAEDRCVEESSGVACACAVSKPKSCELPFRTLGTPDDRFVCGGQVISNDGSTIAGVCAPRVTGSGSANDTDWLAVWRLGEGLGSLTEVGPRLLPSGSSADGSTIVGTWAGGAFRWSAGMLEQLDDLFIANGVTADGSSVVGTCADPEGLNYPCLWNEADGAVPLAAPPASGSASAVAISADGSVIAGHGSRNGVSHAVRWRAERVPEWLPEPDARWRSYVTAISADGSTIAGIVATEHGERAARWTAAGLELSRVGARPVAVSDDGKYVLLDYYSTPWIWGDGTALEDVLAPIEETMSLKAWDHRAVIGASGDLRVILGHAEYLGGDHPDDWDYSYLIRRD
jgi:hypothetical protein